jgi:hypothetical protein
VDDQDMVETSTALRCAAVAWAGDDSPGWIKVWLVDTNGIERFFIDKVPIFTEADLFVTTRFPVLVRVRCPVVGKDGGQVLVLTASDGLATEDGRIEFRVASRSTGAGFTTGRLGG